MEGTICKCEQPDGKGRDSSMADDFTDFWRNDARAAELFYDLLARSERCAYDDEFLAQLAAYREEAPDSERADIFAARYLLHHGDAQAAAVCAERAYRRRPVNYEVWKLLAAIYTRLGRTADALTMYGYANGLYASPIPYELALQGGQEGCGRLSVAVGIGGYAPLMYQRAEMEEGRLILRSDVLIGESIPLTMPEDGARFWVGCYTENAYLSVPCHMISAVRRSEWFAAFGCRDFTFDLQKAQEIVGDCSIHVPEGEEVLIALAGTEASQELSMQTASLPPQTAYLGKWAFSYFRCTEDVTLHAHSDTPYAVGVPIHIGHSPARKRLVLNILVDALPWNVARTRFPECMPNIARFFARGLIFDQHFSTSEHTYPALPAIETGCYPHHTQIFNESDSHELLSDLIPLSVRMKSLGYYCAAPMACGDGIYSGVMRGYDRLIITPWTLHAAQAADRAIHHLEAFDETDQFLFLHVTDVHPWNAQDFKFIESVETHLPLSQRLFDMQPDLASVRLPKFEIYQEQFWQSLHHADRNIGYLLSYIEDHYAPHEYIVNLYSDHGSSVFSTPVGDVVDVIGENSTRAAWMMRGADIPEGVLVPDLTSAVDIYSTLGHLAGFPVSPKIDGNLPAVFGGRARDVVYSVSMFPGQTYKLAVRTHEHTLRLETREVLDEDGTVDFADATVGIYPRAHELAADSALDSAELRAFFYPRARDFVKGTANNGEFWPDMRAARPHWFGA